MAASEEFDFCSDEENSENEWKFDANNDISQNMNASTIPLGVETDKGMEIASETSSSTGKISRMDLNTAKAGMEGLDKEKINQIILEASKGSRFYENEKKKEKQVQKRIEELQRKMASLSDEQKLKAKQTTDKIVEELEQGRDFSRIIVHVDMDAFYAAVEMRDDPSLKSKPMAVGGNAMLCTSNYLARRYGVRAGMPGFIAKKLCPSLTIVRTNFDKYTKISHEIREVLAEYDKNFLPMSLDEAYLDITEYLTTLRSIEEHRDSKEQEMREAKGTRDIEMNIETQKHDPELGEKASTDENDQAGSVVVKQETVKVQELPNRNFGEVTTQVKGELNVDVAKYERDGSGSSQQKSDKIEINHVEDAGPVIVNEHDGKSFNHQKNDEGVVKDDKTEVQGIKSETDLDLSENDDKSSPVQEPAAEHEIFYNKVEEVVKEMRRKIEERTQLTASAGIAPNMFLAKVCSDKNKPNGQFYLKPEKDKVMDFVRELPLRKAFGIGRVSEQILTSVLKVNTCSELFDRRDLMQLLFTPTACMNYLEISLGLGSTAVDVDRERKSISTETTFREINKTEEHFAKCRKLCQELSDSLKAKGLTARKIGIKLKTIRFEVKTRVSTPSYPVQETDEIFSHAKRLLVNEIRTCSPEPLRLRLMGVRAAELYQKGSGNGSKQPTIVSLMKKSGSVPCRTPNPIASNAAGPSKTYEQDEVSQKFGSVSSAQFGSDAILLEQRPSTSELYADQVSFGQPGEQKLDGSMGMGKLSSVNQAASEKETNTLNCPVCGRDLTFRSGNVLLQFNRHVDTCLSKQAITDILKNDPEQQTNQEHNTSKKRKRESPNETVKRRPMDRFLTKQK